MKIGLYFCKIVHSEICAKLYFYTRVGNSVSDICVEGGGSSGVRSAQRTFCFLFATANGLRAERSLFSKRSRVTN